MDDYSEAVTDAADDELQASSEPDDGLRRMEELLLESDEFHDVSCYPCAKDGRDVGAVKYCMDCNQHMCDRCLVQHNRFDLMKHHDVVDKDKNLVKTTRLGLPVQRCSIHAGKLLEMYCPYHDDVCCVVCVALHHGLCSGIIYIPNFSEHNSSNTTSQGQNILQRITRLEKSFERGIRKKEQAEDTLQAEKADIHNKFDTIRQLLNKRLDVLQERLLNNLDEKYESTKTGIDSDKRVLVDAVTLLRKDEEELTTIMREGNDSSKFVQVKMAENTIAQVRGLQESVSTETSGHVFFRPDTSTVACIDGIKSIGCIVVEPSCPAVGGKEVINISLSVDRVTPTISGVCMLNNKLILMTDWENYSLKCFNQAYKVKYNLFLPDHPYDVCCVDDYKVAVTITNSRSIQYVDTRDNLTLSSSFKTGDACRGLAFHGEMLYVACGGNRLKKEGMGHIEVYTQSGQPVKIFSDNLSYPGHVVVARSRVYVADSISNLVVFDLDGKCLKCCNFTNMVNPMSVSDGPDGQIFLGGWSSHNVFALTEQGHYVRSLLEKEDGIRNLHTMYYDWLRGNLICTMRDSKTAIVYNIKQSDTP